MRRLTLALGLPLALLGLASGCGDQPLGRRDGGGTEREDAGTTTRMDVGPNVDTGVGPLDDAAMNVDAATVTGDLRADICGNMFDDDDDGIIDDGCDCAVGTVRPCWLGPPDSRGVGACHDGVQNCNSDGASASWSYCLDQTIPDREILSNGADDDCDGTIDEPDGICVPTSNGETGAECANGRDDDCDTQLDCDDPGCAGAAGCTTACEATETLCWGGHDDDCDGDVDCDDSQCSGNAACATGPCPSGQTPTYRERAPAPTYGGSYIAVGDGRAIMPMTCETGPCTAGNVAVVSATGAISCVPPPPDCATGLSPNYVGAGVWRCDPPCALRIHYGSLFGGHTVCAGHPPGSSCPSGQVWTFVYETQTWSCRPTCSNTTYDRITLDGEVVCVPC